MYTVYKITTTENNRCYIGCTCQSLKMRMSNHRKTKKPFVLMPHKVEILAELDSKEKGEILEAYYIDKFDSCNPEKGWNRRFGSSKWGFPDWVKAAMPKQDMGGSNNGMHGRTHSEETREKMRLKALGRVSSLKGKHLPDDVRLRKNAARGDKGFLRGEAHPLFGKNHSEETKAKISAASIGNQKWLGKKHSEETKAKMRKAKMRRKEQPL